MQEKLTYPLKLIQMKLTNNNFFFKKKEWSQIEDKVKSATKYNEDIWLQTMGFIINETQ